MRHAAHHRHDLGTGVKSFRLNSLPTRWHGFFARHPVLYAMVAIVVALANVIVIGALILALAGE